MQVAVMISIPHDAHSRYVTAMLRFAGIKYKIRSLQIDLMKYSRVKP